MRNAAAAIPAIPPPTNQTCDLFVSIMLILGERAHIGETGADDIAYRAYRRTSADHLPDSHRPGHKPTRYCPPAERSPCFRGRPFLQPWRHAKSPRGRRALDRKSVV